MTIFDKVMARTNKTDSCWNWTGCLVEGHGHVYWEGKKYKTHRVSYEYFKGKIPDGLQIDHLCRNRGCVNPDHLEAVTCKENILRGIGHAAINSKKTHCKRGHEYTKDNLLANKENKRVCKTCINQLKAKYRRQKGMPVGYKKTHCKKGHEYTIENTRLAKGTGWKTCKICYHEWYLSRKNP